MWLDEKQQFLVECESCITFTITRARRETFLAAWREGDRETLMALEELSRYLRLGGDECDREITDSSWLSLAVEGEHLDSAPEELDDRSGRMETLWRLRRDSDTLHCTLIDLVERHELMVWKNSAILMDQHARPDLESAKAIAGQLKANYAAEGWTDS